MESNLCSRDEDIYFNSNQCSGVFPTSGSATGTRIVLVAKMRATVFAMCQGDQAVKYENHQEPRNYGAILGNYKKAQYIIFSGLVIHPSSRAHKEEPACQGGAKSSLIFNA